MLLRITPAWAGKSNKSQYEHYHKEDHPRVGGEKRRLGFARRWQTGSPPRGRGKAGGKQMNTGKQGSPPRGRGKAAAAASRNAAHRITPAWAGKRCGKVPMWRSPWDHPRVGGEKLMGDNDEKRKLGSPPRGRGKDIGVIADGATAGITPAWAGKRDRARGAGLPAQDHPRVGGEKTKKIP